MQHHKMGLLYLLVAVCLIGKHKCHKISSATSCNIVSLAKYSDSKCKHEVLEIPDEKFGYENTLMNSLIVSG